MQQQLDPATRPLLAIEREIAMKERATLLDRLRHVEALLGLPSSLLSKEQRRQEARASEVWGRRGCVAEEKS